MESDVPHPARLSRRGVMMVLSSPSGAGKSTISRAVLASDPGIALSVSVTTRPPRPGEVDGRDYHFIDQAAFDDMASSGGLMEHARVFDHCYGTPRAPVEAALAGGRDILFDIDWQGTQQLAECAAADLVRVFILPPSTAELERRLHARAQDAPAVVARRMARAADEMSHYAEYDWVVVNHTFESSVADVRAILHSERLRRRRSRGLRDFVAGLSAEAARYARAADASPA